MKQKETFKTRTLPVKFVKKANMYCVTSFDERGKQLQTWSMDKPIVI